MKKKAFSIPFIGLKQGKHPFEYQIDNTFFESFGYQEFNGADLKVRAVLNKTSTLMELTIDGEGTVNVNCDLTNEPYNQKLSSHLDLVIKFGEAFNNENDEILILPHGENQFNISQYIYEILVLGVPQKRLHPKVLAGTLHSEALRKLQQLQPKVSTNKNNNTDPRWDKLKKLLTDKK